MRHGSTALWVLIFIPVLLTLTACGEQSGTPAIPNSDVMLLSTPAATGNDTFLAAELTQEKENAADQAAATAEIVRMNALGTLNSANATLSAVQTQDQGDVNLVAAQVAATAAMAHAQAEATLNSASSTQNAALTQDAIQQTQMAAVATTSAQALLIQQNRDALAAGTQTAVANNIATQTQAAAVSAQWNAQEARLDEERRRGPITFLWMWCLPVFLVVLAGLVLWGFWRWLKIQQGNQIILENPVDRLQIPATNVTEYEHDHSTPYLESDIVDNRNQFARPDDQIRRWLDEVKRKLLSSARKDEDDNTND
jgi:hypothetical protein